MGTSKFGAIALSISILASVLVASGCGNKNVQHIGFNKTGYSNLTGALKADSSAQGGSSSGYSSIPGSTNNVIPRSSVGGGYQRSSSQSAHYVVVGGFHVTQNQ